MYHLSESWYLEGSADTERKRYLLLAYLHSVRTDLDAFRIAPAYPDIERRMEAWKSTLAMLREKQYELRTTSFSVNGTFPFVLRTSHTPDDHNFDHILEVLDEAVYHGMTYLDESRNRYHEAECRLQIEPVGIRSPYQDEGFWILHREGSHSYSAFQYRIGPHLPLPVPMRAVTVTPAMEWSTGLMEPDSQIMRRLRQPHWPNPAVFRVDIRAPLEYREAVLPLLQIRFARGVDA